MFCPNNKTGCVLITWVWLSVLGDQMDCFLGLPLCD